MREIQYSVMSNESYPGETSERFAPLLLEFEKLHRIHVNLLVIPWTTGWSQIMKIGLYGKGPDVSEIGTTWIGSLAAMNALRPFTPREISILGGREAFFEASWNSNILPGDERAWGIPWLADTLVIYYWKDALESIGVTDPQAAFGDPETMLKTLEALRLQGFTYPLSMPMHTSNRVLHQAAPWIWNSGGELMSADTRRVTFAEEKGLNGLRSYLRLSPYISPDYAKSTSHVGLFKTKQAAIMIDGPRYDVIGRREDPAWREKIGLVNLFKKVWVGGMNFVIWKHSLYAEESFQLIRFLSSQAPRYKGKLHEVMIYTRHDSFALPSAEDDLYQQVCARGLQFGQAFPTAKLWGSIEEKLDQAISKVSGELFNDPNHNVEASIIQHIESLAKRLNTTLSTDD